MEDFGKGYPIAFLFAKSESEQNLLPFFQAMADQYHLRLITVTIG
jgi:hypothetical protein